MAVQPCIGWIPILKKDAETLFAVHVIMSEHIILELINSVSNSFEYGTFILGINIIYFPKVLCYMSFMLQDYIYISFVVL